MEKVYLVNCPRYDPQTIEAGVRAAAVALGVTLPQGQRVFLHPSCPWAQERYTPHAFTQPAVIEGVVAALHGNTITMGTNSLPGFPTRYSYKQAGYTALAQRLRVALVALDEVATEKVALRDDAVVDKAIALPTVVRKADFTVAVPKLTGSTFVTLAGAIRQHQSLLQDKEQLAGHHRLHSKMTDLLEVAAPDLIVVDAVEALHQGGELSGVPVNLGVLIVGANPVAVDAVAAVAYGLEPGAIRYLQLAAERGYGPAELDDIEILGDLALEDLQQRATRVERIDPHPDHFPLPEQIQVLRSAKSGLSGTCGGLTEVLFMLQQAGVDLNQAREALIIIGKVGALPRGQSSKATVIFLDDTAKAEEYEGYSRIVRLSGRYVPLSTLLNDVPYALKIGNLRNELGEGMMLANLGANVSRFFARLTGKSK